MMPFMSDCRTALQPVGQIGLTDGVEGSDDLFLVGKQLRPLVIRGHAGIYVAETPEPGFSWKMPPIEVIIVVTSRPRTLLAELLSRRLLDMQIQYVADRVRNADSLPL
jgi:hypothetical protein